MKSGNMSTTDVVTNHANGLLGIEMVTVFVFQADFLSSNGMLGIKVVTVLY